MVLASIAGGLTTSKLGFYTPPAILGSCIMAAGAGLLTTLSASTPSSAWIGYQALYGLGMGLSFQAPNLAAQTVLPAPDVPVGTALMFFAQLLGATVFVSVAENVLAGELVRRLASLPGFDSRLVTQGGATALLAGLPAGLRETALAAYNEALRSVFRIGLVLACLAVLGMVGLEWRSVLEKKGESPGGKGGVTDEEVSGSAEKV